MVYALCIVGGLVMGIVGTLFLQGPVVSQFDALHKQFDALHDKLDKVIAALVK